MIHYLIAGLSIFFLGMLLGYFLPRRNKEKGFSFSEESERLFWTDYFATTGKINEGIDHPDDETTRADLLGALKEVLEVMKKIFENRRIEIEMTLADDCPLIAIPKEIVLYVLKCLLLNAAEAMREGGQGGEKISIIMIPPTDKTGDFVRLEIKDNGCGIADEAAPKLFTPFFSTKKKGTGLGLYSARQLIEKFNGKILLESVENGGTRAILFLPGVIVS